MAVSKAGAAVAAQPCTTGRVPRHPVGVPGWVPGVPFDILPCEGDGSGGIPESGTGMAAHSSRGRSSRLTFFLGLPATPFSTTDTVVAVPLLLAPPEGPEIGVAEDDVPDRRPPSTGPLDGLRTLELRQLVEDTVGQLPLRRVIARVIEGTQGCPSSPGTPRAGCRRVRARGRTCCPFLGEDRVDATDRYCRHARASSPRRSSETPDALSSNSPTISRSWASQ